MDYNSDCSNDDDEYDNFYGAVTQHMLSQGRRDKILVTCQRCDFSKYRGSMFWVWTWTSSGWTD